MRGNLIGQGDVYKQNYENAIAAIRESAEFCEANGITLVFEPINRYETNWIHSVKDGLGFLEDLGVESVKLLIDTFHMNIEESNTVEAIKLAGKKIGYVHFADNTRYPPGQGQINYRSVLDALKSVDYSGPVVVEALPLPDDKTAVMNCAAFWKDMEIEL
jgi:sugar phosphate isomerase/epimerase